MTVLTHHRLRIRGGVALLAGAALAAVAAAPAAEAHTPAGGAGPFTASYVAGTTEDVAPAGDSIGDRSVDLFALTSRKGRPAGSATSVCTLIRAGSHPLAQCAGALVLHYGVLTLSTVSTGAADTVFAITGGTGRYTGDCGVVTFHPSPAGVLVTVAVTH